MLGILGQALLIVIISVAVLLGIWILLSNWKSKINIYFFAIAMTILLWNVFAFLGYRSLNEDVAAIFFRINYAAVSIYFVAFYLFTIHFPVTNKTRYYWLDVTVAIVFGAFALLSLFTNFIIDSVKIPGINQLVMKTGMLGNVFYVLSLLLTIYIITILIQKFRILDEKNKSRTKFFLIGSILYASLNIIFNIVLSMLFPENYRLTQLGDFSAIFFLGFTAYAIMKHQLFNIKLIATESIVILLSLILFVQIFISNTVLEGFVSAIIWLLASFGGWQLIKSVKVEIKQKEELAKLANELKAANEHLKDVDKLKDDFLSMASHELNTPIAAIEGYLSMILEEGIGGKIPAKAREYLQSVFQSSQRLAHLVKDLLNVSRVESNRIHIIYEQKQIEDVIDQSIMEVMSKAREAKHTLTFEKPAKKMPMTWLDTTRITEILINMLGNSIKYTPDGGKIVVKAVNDDKKIIVSVTDNGKGIPKERENAVFEKFSQVDVMKDEVKGTGLGMYIAKKFIELMNGKIWFHSDGVGKGTTFYFSLPVVDKKPFDPHEGEDAVLH